MQKVSDAQFSHFVAPLPIINDQSLREWRDSYLEGASRGGGGLNHCQQITSQAIGLVSGATGPSYCTARSSSEKPESLTQFWAVGCIA